MHNAKIKFTDIVIVVDSFAHYNLYLFTRMRVKNKN